MAKSSGITTSVTIDDAGGVGRNLSNDITSIEATTPRGVQDITGLDKAAMERLLLLADGTVKVSGVFNSAVNRQHDVFKTVATSNVMRTVVIVYPGPATLTMEMLFSNYTLSRNQNGELVYSTDGALADGTPPAWT